MKGLAEGLRARGVGLAVPLVVTLLVAAGTLFQAGALAGQGPEGAPAPAPEARIHPPVQLLDSLGIPVLRSGGPVSPSMTCGDCHDTEFIAAHSAHAGPGLLAAASPAYAASSRPWEVGEGEGGEMNCFLCHTPAPDNAARVDAHRSGRSAWAATATLGGTVLLTEDGRWNPEAFDDEGFVAPELLALQSPTSANCTQCHGIGGDDPDTPVTMAGLRSGSLMTLTRGEVFSPQRISESGVNIRGKQELSRAWDVHAERLLECANCHFSSNNPIYRREDPATQPQGLIFDSRRMALGAYLQRPSHTLAGEAGPDLTCTSCHDPEPTHKWLPYTKRHTDALACQVCHTPVVYGVAVESVDWTRLDENRDPHVRWRGCEAGCETEATDLVEGTLPTLLTREDPDGRTRLAPYNLVTSWYWVGGDGQEPVELELVARAGARSPDLEAAAAGLRAAGVEDPRVRTEVRAYPIHHGVTTGPWATRDCQTCHEKDSRLAQAMVLSGHGGHPGGPGDSGGQGGSPGSDLVLPPALVAEAGVALPGAVTTDGLGRLVYTPSTRRAGLYVLGHDSVTWANWAGMGAILLTLLGVGAHGGLRWMASRRRGGGAAGGHGTDGAAAASVYMYSTYERIWHWLQALAILLLLGTGIELHAIRLGILDFALAARVHNVVGFVVVANALFAALFHLASGEIQQYLPEPRGFFGQAITQARYYLVGIFRGEPHPFEKAPERKLNPLQQITYLGILNVLLPLQVVTGVLIWGLQRWPGVESALGGLVWLAPVHALGAWLFAAFLLMHVYLTTTGPTPTANIQAMIVGWEPGDAHEPAGAGD